MFYSFHWENDKHTEYLCSSFSEFYYIASLSKDKKDGEYIANIYNLDNQVITLKDSDKNLLKIKTELEYMNLMDQYDFKMNNELSFEKRYSLLYAS